VPDTIWRQRGSARWKGGAQMGHPQEKGEQVVYRIRVRGAIDAGWSAWFHGLAICPQADGDTLLTGPVRDQAALHGLLAKIRDLGLPLLSVERVGGGSMPHPGCGTDQITKP
jgi:hypothetical protein